MLIKNAVFIDAEGLKHGELLIEKGIITALSENIAQGYNGEIIDAKGLTVMPAFVDLHCHFRTPGFEYKEDIISGSAAAAKGGYTLVNCMANTNPICSSAKIALEVMKKADENGICKVNQAISITNNFDGLTTEHLKTLPSELKIISDDGKGVQSARTMYTAMKIAKQNGLTIFSHAEDMELSPVDYRLAEDLETIRNIELSKAIGARLHMSHVSTKGAMQAIENAKELGGELTCEVAPHHIWFYADTIPLDTETEKSNTYRVNPPIREKADVEYLIKSIIAGKVDAIATDHAPHTNADKQNGAPGMVGLETAFAVCYTRLCIQNNLSLSCLSAIMSNNPAKILGNSERLLRKGLCGDIVIIDTHHEWTVDKNALASKSKNTPWHGVKLIGRVMATVMGGKITYRSNDL